jgi:5'-phosphate synthase pdxT subunit
MLIGVLGLQGAFSEHKKMLENCGCEAVIIKKKDQLEGINGLIIPGGESTTISKLLNKENLLKKIKELADNGLPVFGTCAGMVLLAKKVEDCDFKTLQLMDITVKRNFYGRQIDSFEVDLNISALGENSFRGVFIRAPHVKSVEPHVGIMAEYDRKIVMVRQGNFLSCSFHPELTDDDRIHRYFKKMVKDSAYYKRI